MLTLTLAAPVAALMGLKGLRTLQELRAKRLGFITFGGDDAYQARNVEENIHDAAMIARVKLHISAEDFEALIARVSARYPAWFKALDAAIEHRPAVDWTAPLEIREAYEGHRLTEAPLLTKIVLCRADRTIVLVGNHVYLGGYLLSQFVQLVFCDGISKGIFPKNRYYPVLTELMILGLFAQLALRPRRILSPIYADKRRIERLYWRQPFSALQAQSDALRMHHMYVVMARNIHAVMRHMKRSRLRVTLPVSFEAEDSFNTVGALFLDVEAEASFEALARKLKRAVKRRRWQASASNHVQRILPTRRLSERARNTVDFTLTVVPQKTLPRNLLAEELVDYEFTMDNIHYPVYAMAFIFEGHVHTSYMINTPDFDVTAFIEEDGARQMELTLGRVDEAR